MKFKEPIGMLVYLQGIFIFLKLPLNNQNLEVFQKTCHTHCFVVVTTIAVIAYVVVFKVIIKLSPW